MKRPNYTLAALCFSLTLIVSAISFYSYFAQQKLLSQQLKVDNESISESVVSSIKKFDSTIETINIQKLVNRISMDLDLFEFRYLDKEGVILNSFFQEEINERVDLLARQNAPGEFFFDTRGGTDSFAIFYPVKKGENVEGYIELAMDVTDLEFLTGELRSFAVWQLKHGMTNLLRSMSNSILNSLEVKETLNFNDFLDSLIDSTRNIVQISLLGEDGAMKGQAIAPGFHPIGRDELGGDNLKIIKNTNQSIYYSATTIPSLNSDSQILILGIDATSYVQNKHELLFITLATTLITILFALSIAYTIHSVDVERSKREKSVLEQTVKNRTKEIREILNTMGQGLLTVSKDLRVQAEYSKKTEEILGVKNLSGSSIQDILYRDRSDDDEVITRWYNLIFDPDLKMPVTSLLELGDREMEIYAEGNTKYISIKHRPVYSETGREVIRVMIVLTDITREKKTEIEKEEENLRRERVIKILRKQDIFFSFASDSRVLIEKTKSLLGRIVESPEEKIDLLNEMFRDMHTLKGTGSAFGMREFFFSAHSIENLFRSMAERDREMTESLRENISAHLQELQGEMDIVFEEMRALVGDSFGTGSEVVKIKKENFDGFIYRIGELDVSDKVRQKLFNGIVEMSRVPVGRTFHLLTDLISDTAERLGKKVLPLTFLGGDVEIDKGLDTVLKRAVVHLIRNALDHGIETPRERRELGKPARGQIAFNCSKEESGLVFEVVDDGKGIDPLVIRNLAIEKKVVTREDAIVMTDEEILELIFYPGFTSKSTANFISGRGVGMDVVKVEAEKYGGTVSVKSEVGKGTTVTIKMPEHILMEKSEISSLFRAMEYS